MHLRPQTPAQATLLRHVGHGRLHYDLVLGVGAACPTFAFIPGPWGWAWKLQKPHRRFYLTFQGPVGQHRGRVAQVWRGPVRWSRHNHGFNLDLGGFQVLLRTHAGEAGRLIAPAGRFEHWLRCQHPLA